MNKLLELYNKIAPDKRGHLVVGLLIGLAFGAQVALAVFVVLVAAFGKEAYDFLANKYLGTKHGVELYDALATCVGGAIGIAVVSGIHLIIGRVL